MVLEQPKETKLDGAITQILKGKEQKEQVNLDYHVKIEFVNVNSVSLVCNDLKEKLLSCTSHGRRGVMPTRLGVQ